MFISLLSTVTTQSAVTAREREGGREGRREGRREGGKEGGGSSCNLIKSETEMMDHI